jgi:DNA-binding CsgD family transcriptional regulator/PAS domain-containing protein
MNDPPLALWFSEVGVPLELSMRSTNKTREDDPIVEGIYDAALAPEKWPEALGRVAADVAATSAFFFSTHSDTDPDAVLHVHNQSAEMLNDFGSYWHTEDEWALAAHRRGYMRLGPHAPDVVVGSELVPKMQLSKTPFFNEFCLPHDMTEMLGTIIFDGHEEDGMPFTNLCLYRPPSHANFDAGHKERFARLLPHFRRAMRIQRRVAAVTSDRAKEALGALHIASIVLDAQGTIQRANPSGEELLRALPVGCVRFRQLRSIGTRCSPSLREALASCTVSNPVRIHAYLPGPHPQVITATLLCLPNETGAQLLRTKGREQYLVLADFSRADGAKVAAAVAGVFGLSRAETRVLAGLLDGNSPAAIAEAAGTSIPTVRTQISSVLTKTATKGQTELLLLLRGVRC